MEFKAGNEDLICYSNKKKVQQGNPVAYFALLVENSEGREMRLLFLN